ncbi:facilitated trehalose transporter Tret1-like isoform X2 [Aethina tumida]|uniref:facilitated trehalose transporter Tret1-like isoform X2 n=1 Tax=Aethina tumida TaxID=116153 RepID=UPI00214871B0|nr:facilitated trehalose transporter Tret1-like isoform X2 [Aethina tumida]
MPRSEQHYTRVGQRNQQQWGGFANIIPWPPRNGQHQRLQTESPSLSACTTATNLSTLDLQSSSTLNKQILRNNNRRMLEDNLRNQVPEIEPLNAKKDEQQEITIPEEVTKTEKFKISQAKTQLLAAVAVSWVSMIIGYSSAYTAPAEQSLEDDFKLSSESMTWVVSLMPLGALVGGIFGGTFIEYIGRKWTLLVTNVLFLTAWTLMYLAQNQYYLCIGRAIIGFAVGIASLTLPVYLAETIQPEVRGTLGLLPTAFGNIGILVCYLFGTIYTWSELALVGIILSVPFMVLFIWLIPETPRWFISKGKEEKSKDALRWLRGSDANIDKEFNELAENQKQSEENFNVKDLFTKNNLKLILIVLGLMFFQQMSGINAVIFYTTNIFKTAGSTLDNSLCTTIVGVVNFVSTFIAAVLIDKLGRKILLYISSVAMIISLAVLGAYFYLKRENYDVSTFGWLPLAVFIIYVLGFSLGFGPIPWLMMGEILPAKIRGPAASIATGFNWLCTFVVTKTFLLIIDGIGQHGTFWLYGTVVAVALVFTIICVPETRGQSLQDIEKKLAGIKVRRMSSVANMKPMPSSF